MPSSRATALRPTLLVVAGVVVLAAVAGLALRDRNNVPTPPTVLSPQAAAQPAAPAARAADQKPSFDVVRINPQGNAVMAGRAAPGSDVTIADGGKEVGHAQADQHGDWVFVPSDPAAARRARAHPGGTSARRQRDQRRSLGLAGRAGGPAAASGPAQNATPPLAVLTGPNAAPLVLTGPGPAARTPHRRTTRDWRLGAAEYDEHGEIAPLRHGAARCHGAALCR